MNYLKLVRNLAAQHKRERFTGNEYTAYSCLVELFNDAGTSQDWPDSLFIHDDTLFNMIGISLNKMKECRDVLRKRGMIDFKEPGRGVRTGTEYWLDPTKRMSEKSSERSSDSDILFGKSAKDRQKECQKDRQKECQNLTTSYIYSIPNYPNLQTPKRILSVTGRDDASVWQVILWNLQRKKKARPKAPPIPPAPPDEFPPSWSAEMIRLYVEEWMPFYRKKMGRPLQGDSRRLQIEKLSVLDESGLKACIESSISNNYQGLFPDKFKQRHAANHPRNGHQHSPQQNQPYEFDLDRELAKRAGRQDDSGSVVEGDFELVE